MSVKIDGITDIARYLTDEEAAQNALAQLRWPNGVECPLCEGGKKVYEGSRQIVTESYQCVSAVQVSRDECQQRD